MKNIKNKIQYEIISCNSKSLNSADSKKQLDDRKIKFLAWEDPPT